jgi:hypothetical protein
MKKGAFIISLDFELHWGGFEKWPVGEYEQYFLNTRSVIPAMLALFRKYEVHVTWAGVGLRSVVGGYSGCQTYIYLSETFCL